MELRDQGCRECRRSTGGDCGKHGPLVIPAGPTSLKDMPVGRVELPPEPSPARVTAPNATVTLLPDVRVFHFVCATNSDHQMYVHAQQGLPPEPTICPWKCGWMTLIRLTAMRERPVAS